MKKDYDIISNLFNIALEAQDDKASFHTALVDLKKAWDSKSTWIGDEVSLCASVGKFLASYGMIK